MDKTERRSDASSRHPSDPELIVCDSIVDAAAGMARIKAESFKPIADTSGFMRSITSCTIFSAAGAMT